MRCIMAEMNEAYIKVAAYLGGAFVMAIGTIGPAFGQGLIASKGVENLGKYPESSNSIRNAMLLSMGIVETSAIYALIIALLLVWR